MKKLLFIFNIISIQNIISQQVPLNAIVEHYTNTKCGVCASRNPGLISNKNRFSSLNYISIHPSAPYASCPLSLQNKTTNDARTNYYSIYGGTPRIVINGNAISAGADYSDSNTLKPYLGLMTSFDLKMNIVRTKADSFRYRVVIKKVDTSALTTAILFSGNIEDTVSINGGNGEPVHYNVLRQASQESISLPISVNDSVVKEYSIAINSAWNADKLKSFAIIHNSISKLILQSGFSKLLPKLATAASSQQVPLNAIVEHYTNTKCGVCASRNPGLISNKNRFSSLNYISIHPSAPYASCPLSLQNKTTNDARTNYYSIYGGTPRIVINGNVINAGADYSDSNTLKPFLGLMTSFSSIININRISMDSFSYKLVIKKVDTSSLTVANLFSGSIEDTVSINGGNGEPQHYNVLRQGIQETINLPTTLGDSFVKEYRIKFNTIWDGNRIKAIAIIQNTGNKNLIQSAMSPTIVKSISSSIYESRVLDGISLYPNPAYKNLHIESLNQNLTYEISDLTGKKIQYGKIIDKLISVENIVKGMYLIKIEDKKNNQVVVNTLIKE